MKTFLAMLMLAGMCGCRKPPKPAIQITATFVGSPATGYTLCGKAQHSDTWLTVNANPDGTCPQDGRGPCRYEVVCADNTPSKK